MTHRHTLWITLLPGLLLPAAHAQWIQLSGPVPPAVSEVLEHQGRWFMGTNQADAGDLFVSEDQGQSWSNAGIPNGGVSALVSHGNVLYMGVYLDGLRRSTDGGESWTAHLEGATCEQVLPLDSLTLLAGMDAFSPSSLQRSTDGGWNWEPITGGPTLRCYDLARVGEVILAGGEDEGVFRSLDGGLSWDSAGAGLPGDADLHRFVVHGDTVWAAAESVFSPLEIYRSLDFGQSWSAISVDLPTPRGDRASHFSREEGELLLGIGGTFGARGLFRSTDGGVHWSLLSEGMPGDPEVRAAVRVGAELLAGSPSGLFRSADGDWLPAWDGSSGIGGGQAAIHALGRLFTSVESFSTLPGGIYYDQGAGPDWQAAPVLPQNGHAFAFAQAGDTVYAALSGGARGVARSLDQGTRFELCDPDWSPFSSPTSLLAHEGILLAGSWEGLYRSMDGGQSWEHDPSPGVVYSLAADGLALYAGLYPGGVLRSLDGGQSWEPLNEGFEGETRINDFAVYEGQLYAARNSQSVVRWNGAAWEDAGLESDFVYALLELPGGLLAGDGLGGIHFSEDGQGWSGRGEGFHGQIIEGACLTPDHAVLVTRHRGLWIRPLAELDGGTSVPPRPERIELLRAWPNPFNGELRLAFELRRRSRTDLQVYDLLGRRIRTLHAGTLGAGRHEIRWNGRSDRGGEAASGVYLVHLQGGPAEDVRRVTLLR